MNKIVEKIKDLGKQPAVTKESVYMLALTGSVCTKEERLSEFLKELNEIIIEKARASKFRLLVEVPEELDSEIIQKDLTDRGFIIYKINEVSDIFILSWR